MTSGFVFLLLCGCLCFVSLPCAAVSWSVFVAFLRHTYLFLLDIDKNTLDAAECCYFLIRPRKNYMCGSGYLTHPKFLAPTLNFFLQILNNFVLLFSSNSRIWRKIHIKMTIKLLCIQSLVIKLGLYHFKKAILYQFCLILYISMQVWIFQEKRFSKKSILSAYPNFFIGCNLNHTYFFFIWPNAIKDWNADF